MARTRMYCSKDVLPFTIMVVLECSNVGLNTLFKAATNAGLSYHVFVTYSFVIAAFILLPSPFLYRRAGLPPLNFSILAKIFILGLIGSVDQMVGYKGIQYSSPTLASAMSNLIPAFTFILAILFRMERLDCRSSGSQAKIIGTVLSISGALMVILYKGTSITWFPSRPSMKPTPSNQNDLLLHSSNWVLGGLLLACENILTPIWYIIQAQVMKQYPAELVVVFFYNLFGAGVSAVMSSFAEPNIQAWILKPDLSLAAVAYSGVLSSCLENSVHAWVLHRKGPVYIAMFKPLSIAIAAAMGVLFLGDALYLGSIIGAGVISLGFYAVMWGKAMEELYADLDTTDLESSSPKAPLLRDSKLENNSRDTNYSIASSY